MRVSGVAKSQAVKIRSERLVVTINSLLAEVQTPNVCMREYDKNKKARLVPG
jgi:hypothetical protein